MLEFLLIILVISLDQITKYIAKLSLSIRGEIELIRNYLSLCYVENRGAAFGIFRDKKIILVGMTSIVIAGLIYYLIKNRNSSILCRISIALIIGGAIGNLIDRIYLSYVVDFIHLYIKNIFDWPVFNVADMSVVFGTIILAVVILFSKE